MENIVIRLAANGFIITYNGGDEKDFIQEDFIAFDVADACTLVDCLLREEVTFDMSNIVTDTMPHA